MKTSSLAPIHLPIAFLATVVACVVAANSAYAQQVQEGAEPEIRQFVRTMQEAVAQRDTGVLERLVASAFTSIARDGTMHDRSAFITAIASGGMLFQKADATEQLEEHLAVYGSTAAARTTVLRFRQATNNRDVCVKTRLVLARLDGAWRAISMQETELHDGPIVTSSYDGVIGEYEVEGGRRFTVARVGNTLFGTLPTPTRLKVPLFETPDGGLVGPGGEFVYVLAKDAAGQVTTVTMTRDGKDVWRAKRIK